MRYVEIYSSPSCGYCSAAKSLLAAHRLAYVEKSVVDPVVLAEMRKRVPFAKTIPQVFIDGEHVGGYDDLKEFLPAR